MKPIGRTVKIQLAWCYLLSLQYAISGHVVTLVALCLMIVLVVLTDNADIVYARMNNLTSRNDTGWTVRGDNA